MKFQNVVKVIFVLVLTLIGVNAYATGGITSNAQFDPTKEIEDMRVKVLGGYVRITRQWDAHEMGWVWNKRWEPMYVWSALSLKRGGANYEYTHVDNGKMIFDDRSGNSFLVDPWSWKQGAAPVDVSWQDREGNQINYESMRASLPSTRNWSSDRGIGSSILKSYQDKNGVKVSFERDTDNRITSIKDHHGNTIITFEWALVSTQSTQQKYNLASVTDYTGRKVAYTYINNVPKKLETVTDVRGNLWKYKYSDILNDEMKVIVAQEDPEGRQVSFTIPNSLTTASGDTVTQASDYDVKTGLTHDTESHSTGLVIETWSNVLGEVVRKNINGELQFTVEFVVSDSKKTIDSINAYYRKHALEVSGFLASDGNAESTYCTLIGALPRFVWAGNFLEWSTCAYSHVDAIVYPRDCGNIGCENIVRIDRMNAESLDRTNPVVIHAPDAVDPPPYIKTKIVTDARGNKTTYNYDQWRNEIKVTYPDGTSISRTWHKKFSFPLTKTNEKGIVTAYDYDAKGNLITLTEAKGTADQRITRYTYDQYGQMETITTGESIANNTALAITRYEHDEYGNITKITDPEGNVTQYSDFDAVGNARTVIDARANLLPNASQYKWQFTFDQMGEVLSSFDPYEKGIVYSYDKSGNLNSITVNGSRATFTTNANGLPITITDSNGQVTKLEYDRSNHLAFVTDANGNKNQTIYDQQGRIQRTVDGENNTTQYVYMQNLLRAIEYPSYKQLLDYDKRNRINQITQQANNRNYLRKRGYDLSGNLASTVDVEENTSNYEYDALNRIIKIIDANRGITQFTYDARDNLLQVKDPEGRLTIYTYDKSNRVKTEVKDGDQNTNIKRCYAYDANGNLISSINPEKEKTVYEYDRANRLIKSSLFAQKDQANPIKVVTYAINDKTQLAGWSQQVSNTLPAGVTPTADVISLAETYTYTNLGQLESVAANFGGFTKTYSYSYYPNGLKKTYTNPEGITYTYYYNKNNQLMAVHIPGNGQISYAEFNWLMPQTLLLPGGQKITYSYTDFMQVKERILKNPSQQTVASALYEYDLENNIKKIAANDGDYNFVYDNLYRLKTTDVPDNNPAGDEAFDYDGVGNRIGKSRTGNSTTETLTYNAKNQLTQTSDGVTFTYTNSGHIKTQTKNNVVTEYIYNHEERLIAVKRAGNVVVEYAYNPRGQRVKKTVNGIATWYLYNQNGLAAEYSSSGGFIKEYHFHPQKNWMTDPLFMRTASNEIYYYHNDNLGTPQQLVNSSGAVVWQAQYSAFGMANITIHSVENNLRFPGQYFDKETGLHQNYFRDYDPEFGRYIQSDPISLIGGINPYGYVANNPLMNTDSNGLILVNLLNAAIQGACAAAAGKSACSVAVATIGGLFNFGFLGSAVAGAVAGALDNHFCPKDPKNPCKPDGRGAAEGGTGAVASSAAEAAYGAVSASHASSNYSFEKLGGLTHSMLGSLANYGVGCASAFVF